MQEKLELQATINELIFQVQRQDTQIREMARVVADLGKIGFFLISRHDCFSRRDSPFRRKTFRVGSNWVS